MKYQIEMSTKFNNIFLTRNIELGKNMLYNKKSRSDPTKGKTKTSAKAGRLCHPLILIERGDSLWNMCT